MVKAIVKAAGMYQCNRHLIDHREMTFAFSVMDFYERPAINEKIGVLRQFKTAMVFSRLNEDTKFMEDVFRNRGYNVLHFTDIDEAEAWLKQG